jgi:hypothetical protein
MDAWRVNSIDGEQSRRKQNYLLLTMEEMVASEQGTNNW